MSSIIRVDRAELDELRFEDATILTIDTGTVTRTQAYHIIAAESGVADNLDNVLGGVEGDELIIHPDAGDTITVRHNQGGAGDFWFAGEADIALSDQDHLRCIHDGTSWCDQSGGGGLNIHDHHDDASGGQNLHDIVDLVANDEALLTIAAGVITKTQLYHCVANQGGAGADDLDTINGAVGDGDLLIIRPAVSGTTMTVKHGTGNIWLGAQTDILLGRDYTGMVLIYCASLTPNPGWIGIGWTGLIDHDHSATAYGGAEIHELIRLGLIASTNLTIAAGAVTKTQAFHLIDTQGGAATDDLDTINGANDREFLVIAPVSGARTIVVKHNTGNIWILDGNDISLDDAEDLLLLFYAPAVAKWIVIGGGGGGGGLGVHDHSTVLLGGTDLNPETISAQTFLVGPSCPYTTLGATVAAVNAAGPPSAANPYTILVMGGVTTEVGDITLPDYTAIVGMDESTTIDMGANQLTMGATNSTLANLIVHSHCTGAKDCAVYIFGAANARLWNVLADITPDDVAHNYGFQFSGTSTAQVYHCRVKVNGAGTNVQAFYTAGTSTVTLVDCDGSDSNNDYGLYVDNTLTTTKQCSFYGQTDNVYVDAGSEWAHLDCQYDSGNVTVNGTETVLPQSPVYTPYARFPERAAAPTNVANTGFGYTKDDGAGNTELYFEDESGNETKLTPTNLAEQTNNLLTNAGHEVWQRGAGAFTASLAYTADRWQIVLAGNDTMSAIRSATKKTNSLYASACAVVVGNGEGATQYRQKLAISTSDENHHLLGQAISLRVPTKLLAGVASAVRAFITTDGTGGTTTYSSYHGNNTNWEDLDVMNVTVPSDATYIYVGLAFAVSCTAYVDNCSLVLGSVAVDYQGEHPTELWERCQRYYEAHGGSAVVILQGYGLAAGNESLFVGFGTRKAVSPTMTKSGTWTVSNCAQPITPGGNNTTYRLYTTVTATGGYYTYCDSTDDLITAEANP